MTNTSDRLTRRNTIRAGAAMIGGGALGWSLPAPAQAADYPALGTFPAGSSGDSVFVGIAVPRTGTYAVQGEDVLKGYQLAIEHLNTGNALIRKMSPKTTKGVLGKTVTSGVADNEAKPNTAVQAQSRFISENKAVVITGCVSSAVAVALNKLAQPEKVIYLPAISGSNDTTGKDCTRYGFRDLLLRARRPPMRPWRRCMIKNDRHQQEGRVSSHLTTPTGTPSISPWRSSLKKGGWTDGDQPGLPARRAGLQLLPAEHRQQRRRRVHQHQLRQRRRAVHQAGAAVRHPVRSRRWWSPTSRPVPGQGGRAPT